MVTTQVHHSTVFTDIHLPKGVLVTLFGVRKQAVGGRTWLLRTENTVILEHSTIDMDKFKVNAEVCAGIGAATTGFEACGVATECYNEQNSVFIHWLHSRGKKVIAGDISDAKVVSRFVDSSTGILSGGVSCQPWSALGDQRGFDDERSRSLPGTLKAIYLLQTPLAMLECTQAIMQSDAAQAMLRSFSMQTGMVIQQKLLNLHTFWPARRLRWWQRFHTQHCRFNRSQNPSVEFSA